MKQNTWFHLSLSLVLCQQYSRFTGSYERYFLLILVDTCLVILHKYLKLLFSLCVLPCNVPSYDFIDLITIYFKHFFTTTVVNYSINFPAMRLSTTTLSSVKHSGFIRCYRLFCTEQWRWQRIPSPYFPTSFLLSQHWHFNISRALQDSIDQKPPIKNLKQTTKFRLRSFKKSITIVPSWHLTV